MKFAVRKVVALLLAMLMLVSSMASFAEGTVEYSDTVSSYNLNPATVTPLTDEECEAIIQMLSGMSYDSRYTWLNRAIDDRLADCGEFTEEQIAFAISSQNYSDLVAYYKTNHAGGRVICICDVPHPYGEEYIDLHDNTDCQWRIIEPTLIENSSASSNGVAISGTLPENCEFKATSDTAPDAFVSMIEGVLGADENMQFTKFDLTIETETGAEWQPTDGMYVTIPSVWSGDTTPRVYVYHFFDTVEAVASAPNMSNDASLVAAFPKAAAAATAAGYEGYVAYEVLKTTNGTATYNAETKSVTFHLDSFSEVAVASTDTDNTERYNSTVTWLSSISDVSARYEALLVEINEDDTAYLNGYDDYFEFRKWYFDNNANGTLLCSCGLFDDDPYNDEQIHVPGVEEDHETTCPWHPNNISSKKTITDENGLASVTGNIPAGATLEVSEVDVTEEINSILNYDAFEVDTVSVKAYDIKIIVDEIQWQPVEPVRININDVCVDGISNPLVEVYHISDSSAESMEYETFSSDNMAVRYDGNGIAFYVDGFSMFVVTVGSSSSLTTLNNNNNKHDLYITPGAYANMSLNGSSVSNVSITGSTDNIVATNSSKTLRISVSENATIGETAKINVSWRGGSTNYSAEINVYVVTEDEANSYNEWLDTNYSSANVVLAIRQDGSIPGEPTVHGGSGYLFYTKAYVGAPQDGWEVNTFSTSASTVINKDILKHEKFVMNADGDSQGLPLNSGANPKAMVSGVDWDAFLLAAVKSSYASTIHINNTDLTLADIQKLTDAEILASYEVVPYVVKYENDYGNYWSWHIDCAIKPKEFIVLSYNLNVPNDMSYSSDIGLPNSESGPNPSTFTVGSVDGLTNGTMLVDGYYTFTFLEWNTSPDGKGTSYDPNDKITITKDTVLYAIWDSNPALGTGNLLIRKLVAADEIDTTEEFTFKVDINDIFGQTSTDGYEYKVYNEDNLSTGISGTIRSGGTVTLKHGQYVVIYDVPAASEKDAEKEEGVVLTPNVTVTEQNVPDGYTNAWSGGTTAANPTTVKIEGGRRSELTCTNTKATPKVEVDLKKIVDGNIGDRNKVFTFTVTSSDGTLTNKEYTLSHNSGAVKLPAIKVGSTITIVESSAGYETKASTTNTSNIVKEVTVTQNTDKTEAKLADITVTDDLSLITVTNTKDITVDTGILLDSAPYVLLLALVGAGIAFMIIRRRRRED